MNKFFFKKKKKKKNSTVKYIWEIGSAGSSRVKDLGTAGLLRVQSGPLCAVAADRTGT